MTQNEIEERYVMQRVEMDTRFALAYESINSQGKHAKIWLVVKFVFIITGGIMMFAGLAMTTESVIDGTVILVIGFLVTMFSLVLTLLECKIEKWLTSRRIAGTDQKVEKIMKERFPDWTPRYGGNEE